MSVGCVAACTDTFQANLNKNALGATRDVNADTEAECQAACVYKSFVDCPAFEFNDLLGECWLHSEVPSSLGDSPGVTHFTRVPCVPGGETDFHPSHFRKRSSCNFIKDRSTYLQSGFMLSQSSNLFVTSACTDTFELNENQNGGGANQESGTSTESACKSVCLSRPYSQCAAYEFNSDNNECWIHSTKPDRLNSAQGINHYARIRCSSGGRYLS